MKIDKTGVNYIPNMLPCGKSINQNWEPGQVLQCCQTECPSKSINEIEDCYRKFKGPMEKEKAYIPEGKKTGNYSFLRE